ncbi:MAG TPA: hypothetical protein VEB21_16255 [Terriglobales bacterium]|nr:hypothetical protein [Terriglobales bacterium]
MAKSQGLSGAAQAMEAELGRFEELTEALQRERLSSEKALKRAAQRLEQIAECDQRMAERLQQLVGVITEVRQRQEAGAATVQRCALAIQQRAAELSQLHSQGEALRQEAALVGQRAQQLLASDNGSDENGGIRRAFEAIQQSVRDLAASAQAFAEAALAKDFPDLARDGESLRMQLLATSNKLDLLSRRMG